MFDPPVGGAPLVQAARVTIRHRAGSDATALLLLAWLGVLLGWRPLRSAQTSDGGAAVRFRSARGQPVAGHLVPADGACGRSGILGIELTTGRAAIATRSAARRSIRPCCRRRACRRGRSSWIHHSDAELASRRSGSRGRDPLFTRCLSYARQLWSLETDTAGSRR